MAEHRTRDTADPKAAVQRRAFPVQSRVPVPSASPAVSRLAGLQALVSGSPAVQRLAALQAMSKAGLRPLQRAQEEDEPMQGRLIQRAEDEELLQGKPIQRAEDEELLQGKPIQRAAQPDHDTARAPSGDSDLPAQLRAGIEGLSGLSMAGVKVHQNSDAPAQVGAHAFAQGREIHLAPGQDKHLPHEAWHIVQQAQGRVQPTRQVNGAAVNDNPGLEAEADRMGARAKSGSVPSQLKAASDPARQDVPGRKMRQLAAVRQLQQTDVCLRSASGTYTLGGVVTPFAFQQGSKGSDVMVTTKSHPNDLAVEKTMAEKYLKKQRVIPRTATDVTFTTCDTYGIKK